jgi:hypothetical protein
VASSKPRVMLKLIIAAVGGGLIGAFLSMFFTQVSYEKLWFPPLVGNLNIAAVDIIPVIGCFTSAALSYQILGEQHMQGLFNKTGLLMHFLCFYMYWVHIPTR